MSVLNSISKPADRPVIATIFGNAGMGKTTLAVTFPKPIVIRAEDGLQAIPTNLRPDAFPLLTTPDELWDQLKALINEPHEYETLIVDSVTALERMFAQHIVDTDAKKPKGIQQALGGYGAGREAVAAMHARLRKAAGLLADKRGMHTVFIAHSEIGSENPPDDEAFSKWGLRLHAKSEPAYVDDVDLVGYLKLETFTTGDGEKKKAISDGTRVLVCHATAANVSKNRFGISEPLAVVLGTNPLVEHIPSLRRVVAKKEKSNG